MNDRVSLTIDNHIADVRLVRGNKMNALDAAMMRALIDTGERLKDERDVRAVVISGEGRAFCAGLDMANFAAMADKAPVELSTPVETTSEGLAKRTKGIANTPQYVVWVWREIPVPVIAAVHGVAFGGGLQLMLGADCRYAAPDTRFSIMEIKWGLIPDMCGTQLLRHLAPDDIVRELTYTGRIFEAEEAARHGFLTRICDDPHMEALATARDIAGRSPDAVRAAKRLLHAARTGTTEDGLIAESVEQGALIGSPNQIEAVMANLEQREPAFKTPKD